MQELADRVWGNERFHEAAAAIQQAWIARELGSQSTVSVDTSDLSRIMQAAAILACSEAAEHRRTAYRAATAAYELGEGTDLPIQQALRVVLARLGNFPAMLTRSDVDDALPLMPPRLIAEELALADQRRVTLREKPVLLTGFQHNLWTRLRQGRSVAVAAPTSAGKSFVMQGHLAKLFENDGDLHVVYIVPTRALIAQVSRDLAEAVAHDGTHKPVILTVPVEAEVQLPSRSICVMTQERMQLLLTAHPGFAADVVIVDEAHSIADGARGVLLQWVIDELLRRKPGAQLLFASPGIRNLEVFGRTFGLDNVEPLPSREPTVAQNFLSVRVLAPKGGQLSVHIREPGQAEREVTTIEIGQTLASRIDRLVHIPAALGRGAANIVYANGAAEAEAIALQLADLFADRVSTPRRDSLAQLARESVHGSFVLADCIVRGVAFHYSNIPTQLRQAIESAVSEGDVDYLVCTSTLLQGVNLPARNIFMCRPEKGHLRPLESTDFWNLAGRAGRLRREFQGNIFLIDYDDWKRKPLEEEREAEVVPAIEKGVRERRDDLIAVMTRVETASRDPSDVEAVFSRLLDDLVRGQLDQTMGRLLAGGELREADAFTIAVTLREAAASISLPLPVLRRSPNVSPHKQQDLYDTLRKRIETDPALARSLIPAHPREGGAFDSYAAILELCHRIILGLPASNKLHRFHALMSVWWMQGHPLPFIVDKQIDRLKPKDRRATIRKTLEIIEKDIRFQVMRLFSCYCAVLLQALNDTDMGELANSVPAIPLFLEVGASDRTMISFMALGLSRVGAAILNQTAANKNMDTAEALSWLKTRPLEAYGLSPFLLEEATRIAREA